MECRLFGIDLTVVMAGSTERPEPNRQAERSRAGWKGGDGVKRRGGSGRWVRRRIGSVWTRFGWPVSGSQGKRSSQSGLLKAGMVLARKFGLAMYHCGSGWNKRVET